MLVSRVIGGLALLIPLTGPFAVAAAEAPSGASSCSGCHAVSAAVQTPVPPIAGRATAEIVAAMREFRSGHRPGTVMDRIAKGFSEAETAAIADWYAGQKP